MESAIHFKLSNMWSNIIGQGRVQEILKNIFRSDKISHSYIFFGNEGTGKDATAIEFAKLINCDNPIDGVEACDKCKTCFEINLLKSPLLKYIIALPTGKNETDEDKSPLEKLDKEDFVNYLNEISQKADDKYYKVCLPKANDIRISSIRQIKREIYMTGKDGKKKIFIISNCDMMNQQSANAILKILEEPPKNSIIILTTSRLNSLFPTIIGRCHKIRFDNLKKEDVVYYINKKYKDISSDKVELYAEFAEGSISKCNEIIEKNFLELRDKVLDFLSSIASNQHLKLGRDIDFIVGKKEKERVKQFLILLIVWFRDIIYKSLGNDSLVVNLDKIDRVERFVSNFESQNYEIINCVEEAIRDLESNIFLDLLLYNLSYKLKFYIKKKSIFNENVIDIPSPLNR